LKGALPNPIYGPNFDTLLRPPSAPNPVIGPAWEFIKHSDMAKQRREKRMI